MARPRDTHLCALFSWFSQLNAIASWEFASPGTTRDVTAILEMKVNGSHSLQCALWHPKPLQKFGVRETEKRNPKKKNLLMLAKTRPEGVLYEADKWVGDGRKQLIQEIQRENGGHNNIIIITFCTLMYNMKKKTQNLNKRVKWCYFYGMFSHLFLHNFFFNFGENKIYLHPMMYWYRIK